MRRLLPILFIPLCLGCGKPNEVDLDALEAPSNRSILVTADYPAVVMVVMPGGRGVCTGTFVSPNSVLTAAHCTQATGSYLVVSSFGKFHTSSVRNLGPGEVDDPEDVSLLVLADDVADPRKGRVIPVAEPPSPAEKVRLVGFGCNDFESRLGTGVKRTGTNQVFRVGDYVELHTPKSGAKALIGSDNRTGTCFGDSGGPLLRWANERWGVSAISHAGGRMSDGYLSAFVNLSRSTNTDFLRAVSDELGLGLFDDCRTSENPGFQCTSEFASAQIVGFLKLIWNWLLGWF
jgi:hypothetical protein